TVNDQEIVLAVFCLGRLRTADFAIEASLSGIVFEKIGEVVCGNEVVHRHDVDFVAEKAFVADRSKDEATDAAKAVNADFYHNVLLVEVENTRAESAASQRFGTFGIKIDGVCVCIVTWSLAYFSAVNGVLAEHFFNAQQLIVFGHQVRSAEGT